MIIQRLVYREYHENGQICINGEIGVVAELWKHLYDYRLGFKGYEGRPVVRLGTWTKFYDNGQLAWTLVYDEYGYSTNANYPQYRKDGTLIIF